VHTDRFSVTGDSGHSDVSEHWTPYRCQKCRFFQYCHWRRTSLCAAYIYLYPYISEKRTTKLPFFTKNQYVLAGKSSDFFQCFPPGCFRKAQESTWKIKIKIPAGILIPCSSYFRCFPAGYGGRNHRPRYLLFPRTGNKRNSSYCFRTKRGTQTQQGVNTAVNHRPGFQWKKARIRPVFDRKRPQRHRI